MKKKRTKSAKSESGTAVIPAQNGLTGKGVDAGITNSTALIPQPHGGALKPGGTKGSPPGPGRTPEAIKGTFRQIVEVHGIPWVMRVLSGEESAEPGVKARLLDTLVRAAVGHHKTVEHQGHVTLHVDTETQPE